MSCLKNKLRGDEAEFRVMEYLNRLPGRQCVRKRGVYGVPDLVLTECYMIYGVEVKSTQAIINGKAGTIRLTKTQWLALNQWSEENMAESLLIVEIKPRGTDPIYFRVEADKVNTFLSNRDTEYVAMTVWQIIRMGEKI